MHDREYVDSLVGKGDLHFEVIGQRIEPDRAVLECRVAEPDQWCRRCGAEGVPRDSVRRRLAHEDDGLIWYCQRCNHKLYEEYFHLHDIEQDLPPVFDRFYRSTEHRSCRHCGHLHPRPDRYDAAPGSLADIT